MPIAEINKIKIYYELHGSGKPLILIAGYTGDHTFWHNIVKTLSQKFQILIFDNRAIGQTIDDGSDFTLEDQAQDIMELSSYLNLQKPHILGQSMGGTIVQVLAKNYPNNFDKLIILNSLTKFNIRSIKVFEGLIRLRQEINSFDLLINLSLPWFFSSQFLSKQKNIDEFKQVILNNPYPQSIADQERQLKNLLNFDSQTWVSSIKNETLVVAGLEDIITLPNESKEMADKIANSKFVTIPGAHSSPIEHPNLVNKLVLEFLT